MGQKVTHEEWEKQAKEIFGDDYMGWAFKCPVCGHVATVKDYKEAGATEGAVGFSCVGRWLDKSEDAFDVPVGETAQRGPCNYAGGGLIRLNPVTVIFPDGKEMQVMEFAKEAVGEQSKS